MLPASLITYDKVKLFLWNFALFNIEKSYLYAILAAKNALFCV